MMKKNLLNLLLAFCCFNLANAQVVFKEFVDGRIYVKFTPSSLKTIAKEDPKNIPLSSFTSLGKLFSKYGVTKMHKPFYHAIDDEALTSILKLEFTQKEKINAFIEELQKIQGVEYAEKVRLNKTSVVPNDALFSTTNGSVHLNQIDAQNAWNVFNGNSNITVAVVDNAVMGNHIDLIGNTYTNTAEASGLTGVDDDGNGYIDDINGFDVAGFDANTSPTNMAQNHGTHCAGIAGARTDNSIGVSSIGWNVKIIPVKASFDNSFPTDVDMGYEGIIYAVRSKAKIISCSWGNTGGASASEQLVINYAWNRGCIIFASAGNNSNSLLNYPGAYNNVYCVAAVNPADVKSGISSFGSWVDISAPGDNILSTFPYTGTPDYQSLTGTSMATPMVAGLAALMLSKSPNMTRTDVLNCISSTAANIYTIAGNSAYVSGSQLGAGRINAFAAMNCAATYTAVPPVANFYAFLPYTCPNTLIPFIDSSLYNPTSWSWVFQGGTPATSTSSNPSVQWSTPGTYSVSLTVTNLNGTHTKTKLSYITVSGPTALPFSEGFQAAQFLPAGWAPNNIWNDNIYWQRATGVGGFGTSTACAKFDNFSMNAPGEHDEMRSPKFDFTNVAKVNLRFDVAYARYNATYSDTLQVKVSTNCGTTWTSIYLKGGTVLATAPDQGTSFTPSANQWRTDIIDISALTAGQTNVMFSFLNRGHFGQPIYIDNINLSFPTPTLSVNNSASICVSPTTYTLNNTSLGAANYTWNFQGGSPATSTATNPVVTFATPGTYTFNMTGVNGPTLSTITKTITVINYPSVSSSSGSYCGGNTYTLNASGATSYTWSSSAGQVGTASTLVFTPLANSFYTLTGSNGACTAQGIYTINVNPSPSMTISNQATICPGGTATLIANGASTYSWNTSAITNSIIVSPNLNTTYTVVGTSSGCSTTKTISVLISQPPVSVVSPTGTSCFGTCNGMVDATSSNGIPPYTYSLSGGGCNSLPCLNLCAGAYSLQTTDAIGCISHTLFSIISPPSIQPVVSVTNAACASCPDGAALVNPAGGNSPFIYTWFPSGGTSSVAVGLTAGCYTVSISDANGCTTQTTACVSVGTGLANAPSLSQLSIYPNPAESRVVIELEGSVFDFSIYNSIGQIIFSKKDNHDKNMVDLNKFAKGLYIIEVESNKNKITKKLVVE